MLGSVAVMAVVSLSVQQLATESPRACRSVAATHSLRRSCSEWGREQVVECWLVWRHLLHLHVFFVFNLVPLVFVVFGRRRLEIRRPFRVERRLLPQRLDATPHLVKVTDLKHARQADTIR